MSRPIRWHMSKVGDGQTGRASDGFAIVEKVRGCNISFGRERRGVK
jgi:hypothetical protein